MVQAKEQELIGAVTEYEAVWVCDNCGAERNTHPIDKGHPVDRRFTRHGGGIRHNCKPGVHGNCQLIIRAKAPDAPLPPVSSLKIAPNAHKALADAGIDTLEQAATWTRGQLLALRGMGEPSLQVIEAELSKHRIALAGE